MNNEPKKIENLLFDFNLPVTMNGIRNYVKVNLIDFNGIDVYKVNLIRHIGCGSTIIDYNLSDYDYQNLLSKKTLQEIYEFFLFEYDPEFDF